MESLTFGFNLWSQKIICLLSLRDWTVPQLLNHLQMIWRLLTKRPRNLILNRKSKDSLELTDNYRIMPVRTDLWMFPTFQFFNECSFH
ncbi:unnamed protein product [Allacma fusca]|uniref:Uncharacterized protein n=1 Tax=Allacma fusca TaxID=39272 RepID=A0A8J2P7Q1_9HEXA|nr:unnamed protein product [Allacma fusca]